MSAQPTLRRCVSCRELFDRRQLLRIIRLAGGAGVVMDEGMGRSAYVCASHACVEAVSYTHLTLPTILLV